MRLGRTASLVALVIGILGLRSTASEAVGIGEVAPPLQVTLQEYESALKKLTPTASSTPATVRSNP